MPVEREQYIHRVGRTGRAGKGGKGFLLLAEHEAPFLKAIADLPVRLQQGLQPAHLAASQAAVDAALSRVSNDSKELVCARLLVAFQNGSGLTWLFRLFYF
jgi:ATP-dependent RNA helicase MSS116, mitochondrial